MSTPSQRLLSLDFNRGIALIGIYIINLRGMLIDQQFSDQWKTPIETLWFEWLQMLVKDKFYTIFALLFGMGIALMIRNLKQREKDAFPVMNRRFLILGLIGFIHYTFFWQGDILLIYAFVGWMLLLVHRLPLKWLLVLVFILYILQISVISDQVLALSILPDTWMDQTLGLIVLTNTFAYFSLGYVIIQHPTSYQWLQQPKRLVQGSVIFGVITIFGFMLWFFGAPTEWVMTLINLPQALFIFCMMAWITLLFRHNWLITSICRYGACAMTHYLSQTLIGIFLIPLFLPPTGYLIPATFVAIAICTCQIIFSHQWMKVFRYGPLEWVWRAGTYLTFPPNRRTKQTAHHSGQ